MARPILHYLYDPLCGWCYAAGPLVAAATEAGVRVVLHGGGLFDRPTRVDAAKRAYMRESDGRIAEMTGVPFGAAYLDGLLADPETVFWSPPVIAAILAADAARDGADLALLRAVQHAHYVEGRRVVEAPVLAELATSIGLAGDRADGSPSAMAVDKHLAASRALMQRAGVRGCPGFLVERDGRWERVDHERFYGRPAEFVEAIAASG